MRIEPKHRAPVTDSKSNAEREERGRRAFKDRLVSMCLQRDQVASSGMASHGGSLSLRSPGEKRPVEREIRPRDPRPAGEMEQAVDLLPMRDTAARSSLIAPRVAQPPMLDAPVATWVSEYVTRLQLGEMGSERTVRLRAQIAGRERSIALSLSKEARLSVEIEDIDDPALLGFVSRLRDSLAALECEIR